MTAWRYNELMTQNHTAGGEYNWEKGQRQEAKGRFEIVDFRLQISD
jgi:hypothetical protein